MLSARAIPQQRSAPAHQLPVSDRSVVVPPATNRATRASHEGEDDADDREDDPHSPEDRDARDEADDHQDDAKYDQSFTPVWANM